MTPSDLLRLALERHRRPWNWTLQFAGLVCFALALLFHSYLWLAVSLILAGAGFFELRLPEPGDSAWFRFVRGRVEWEKNWAAFPWTWRKGWRFGAVVLLSMAAMWAMWTRDLAVLTLMVAMGALVAVARKNREQGIDP